MRYLDLTLPGPPENLALDEALLEELEIAQRGDEVLRLWEPAEPMVVLGRSSKIAEEVRQDACQKLRIPVLRRPSGGAAVVVGPGCLMYAAVLDRRARPELRGVDRVHRFVLGKLAAALAPLEPGVECRGTSDLALGGRKFSGNSVRLKRDHLLYHGTVLIDFALELIDRCLAMPPRQPEYRRSRAHREFVTNLPLPRHAVRQALLEAWTARRPRDDWPRERTARLAAEKYSREEWNAKL